MNQNRINGHLGEPGLATKGIPIQFEHDVTLSTPIKIKLLNPMSTSSTSSKLIPDLFHLAARADEPESVLALKHALARGRKPLSERMLDPQKLESVLNAVTRRKRSASRHLQEKRLELSASEAA